MDARLDYLGSPLTMKVVKHINSARAVLHDSGLPAATQGLVEIRARSPDQMLATAAPWTSPWLPLWGSETRSGR